MPERLCPTTSTKKVPGIVLIVLVRNGIKSPILRRQHVQQALLTHYLVYQPEPRVVRTVGGEQRATGEPRGSVLHIFLIGFTTEASSLGEPYKAY